MLLERLVNNMKINRSKDCGNSPKNKLIERIFISFMTKEITTIESHINSSIEIIDPDGEHRIISPENINIFECKTTKHSMLDILNIATHGKSAAINAKFQTNKHTLI